MPTIDCKRKLATWQSQESRRHAPGNEQKDEYTAVRTYVHTSTYRNIVWGFHGCRRCAVLCCSLSLSYMLNGNIPIFYDLIRNSALSCSSKSCGWACFFRRFEQKKQAPNKRVSLHTTCYSYTYSDKRLVLDLVDRHIYFEFCLGTAILLSFDSYLFWLEFELLGFLWKVD